MKKVYKDYNGWKNRQTWNVALHIGNNYNLYKAACAYMAAHLKHIAPYMGFVKSYGLVDVRTNDNISFSGSRLDYKALNDFMRELP